MTKEDRKQDVWFVRMVHTNGDGTVVLDHRGILDLHRPMTDFEAADYAVRIGVRETVKGYNVEDGHEILAEIYGRYATTPGERGRQCTAVGKYDEGMDVFKRLEPWRGDDCWSEVSTTDGARFLPLEWN